ncbi:MAG: ribosomal L7Ae/L30e/S12e/Gadd45 family protein [Oscillospiraceae bacterium]|jgi:ribosomal protein L7Ae-like RNA K-turn-binding protein|nr:ribosomal L7Ae/L30e/S12e/Gadd45 family protein [Oscillospiraceae bacterium]
MYKNFLSFLGLARRAGKLHLGFSAAASCVNYDLVKLILVCEDISENSFRKIVTIANRKKLRVIKIKISIDDVGIALGKRSGIIAIADRNFAKNIFELLKKSNISA